MPRRVSIMPERPWRAVWQKGAICIPLLPPVARSSLDTPDGTVLLGQLVELTWAPSIPSTSALDCTVLLALYLRAGATYCDVQFAEPNPDEVLHAADSPTDVEADEESEAGDAQGEEGEATGRNQTAVIRASHSPATDNLKVIVSRGISHLQPGQLLLIRDRIMTSFLETNPALQYEHSNPTARFLEFWSVAASNLGQTKFTTTTGYVCEDSHLFLGGDWARRGHVYVSVSGRGCLDIGLALESMFTAQHGTESGRRADRCRSGGCLLQACKIEVIVDRPPPRLLVSFDGQEQKLGYEGFGRVGFQWTSLTGKRRRLQYRPIAMVLQCGRQTNLGIFGSQRDEVYLYGRDCAGRFERHTIAEASKFGGCESQLSCMVYQHVGL